MARGTRNREVIPINNSNGALYKNLRKPFIWGTVFNLKTCIFQNVAKTSITRNSPVNGRATAPPTIIRRTTESFPEEPSKKPVTKLKLITIKKKNNAKKIKIPYNHAKTLLPVWLYTHASPLKLTQHAMANENASTITRGKVIDRKPADEAIIA